MTTYYKVLVDGRSAHGGTLEWPLPKGDKPGDWVEVEGALKMCERGIHLTSSPFSWYRRGCAIYETDYEGQHGEVIENKICVRRARLMRQVEFPKPWRRVETFLNTIPGIQWFKPDGEPEEAWSLHVAPAGAAAGDAARDAARDAAGDAARDAARAAAWDAARAAAWDAARDAELMALVELVRDTDIDPKHIAHAEARWRVWQKGYGLYCDVNGKLFVYGLQPEAKP